MNSAVSNFRGWHGTDPIPYNVYGQLTWVVPVVSETFIFQRIAFVRSTDATVKLGDDVADALRQYRTLVASSGADAAVSAQADVMEFTGVISRVRTATSTSGEVYYVFFNDIPTKIFTATAEVSPEIVISEPGDEAAITYLETEEPIVPLDTFNNLAFELQRSEEQEALEERRAEVEQR